MLNEFDIIASYFKRENSRNDVIVGIGDDCAVVQPPANKYLLATTDTLNVGSHFFPNTSPFEIGYKAVAVSLSDLAAMGGEPAWLLLALTLPDPDPEWLKSFSNGLFSSMQPFNMALIGGNLSRGPLAVTTQIIGFSDREKPLLRSAAKVGDFIFVTGSLGDARLGLAILKEELNTAFFTPEEITHLTTRLFKPLPRIKAGKLLGGLANACIDISDGLLADLQHILDADHLGATIHLDKLPISSYLEKVPTKHRWNMVLNGGDDYELCFTVSPEKLPHVNNIANQLGCWLTCIGEIDAETGIRVVQPNGDLYPTLTAGYQHF